MTPIYLDNAATSQPKPEAVYRAADYWLRHGGSSSRGQHQLARAADRLLFSLRESLARLFNAPAAERFVFTANATQALNQALFGLLQPGDRVVTSTVEHNALVRPLRALEQRGVELVRVAADRQGLLALDQLQQACLAAPTRLLAIAQGSNVSGALQPIESLGRWCRAHNILLLVDAAQTAGALPIDISAMQIDLLAAPGHKSLLGPQGTGFLYVGEGLQLQPLIYGGTGAHSETEEQPLQMPERLEAGTMNLPALAGLEAALGFLLGTGVDTIRRHEQRLLGQLQQGLQRLPGVHLYGPDSLEQRCSVLSFTLAGRDVAEIGFRLDREFNIAVRTGLHCAPLTHKSIASYPGGSVRVSPGFFNTEQDIEQFLAAIESIARS